jgi:hypothetical protein
MPGLNLLAAAMRRQASRALAKGGGSIIIGRSHN